MSTEPQLFRVDPDTKVSEKVEEVDFAHLGLQERRDIQEWIVANPGILGDDLLIIAKEFSDFDKTNDRLDLLAVDTDGKLVIIELKRDYSGVDAHWQAIKYASYLRQTTPQKVVELLAAYKNIGEAEAEERLIDHIESPSRENLNSEQRIILVSHRFAREVTSAVLWLNDKAQDENLISCVQLIPYQDSNVLYVQTNTIIPVVGTERYSIQIGAAISDGTSAETSSSAGIRAARRRARNRDDEITHFVRKVEVRALEKLPDDLKTDSDYGYARGGVERYYSLWYKDRHPWTKTQFSYIIHVYTKADGTYRVVNNLEIYKSFLRNKLGFTEDVIDEFKNYLENLLQCTLQDNKYFLRPRVMVAESATTFDDDLVEKTADSLETMIEAFTVKVEEFVSSHRADN